MLRERGRDKYIGTFKVCISKTGRVASVRPLMSTRVGVYDQFLMTMMLETWEYRPFVENGRAIAVCTSQTFIYRVTR